MRISFAKLHGLGNDFLVTDAGRWPRRGRRLLEVMNGAGKSASGRFLSRLARVICERHTGVGADGFLLVLSPRDRTNDARVRFFNADGTEAEMSGNGIRCVGAFLAECGNRRRRLRIETPAGVRTLELVDAKDGKWVFRVAMGLPVFDPEKIPFDAKGVCAPVASYPLATQFGVQRVTVTSMGNPHCSLFVKDFNRVDWPAHGRAIETHRLFPRRTNVEFVRVVSRREIEVRYWERGVGITASSGTGSCAAAVASILNGYTGRTVSVRTMAGDLLVDWPEGGVVVLTGPAQWIAEVIYWQTV